MNSELCLLPTVFGGEPIFIRVLQRNTAQLNATMGVSHKSNITASNIVGNPSIWTLSDQFLRDRAHIAVKRFFKKENGKGKEEHTHNENYKDERLEESNQSMEAIPR